MAKRKQYPLRIDADVWAGIERWAADDLRSVNAQVEFIPRPRPRGGGRTLPRSINGPRPRIMAAPASR